MAVLNSNQIKKLAEDPKVLLLGENYNEENVRGSSYDLRIGAFLKKKEIISLNREVSQNMVKILPSDIISMLTFERVSIPTNLCATVFPINKKSSSGLLILNPGHIDPGYSGPISICAINLSDDIIWLSLKDPIFTIIFESLDKPTYNYKNNWTGGWTEYEDNFFKKHSSKLSNSFFDLISSKKYESHLQKQINLLINHKINKTARNVFVFLIGLVTIAGTIYAVSTNKDKQAIIHYRDSLNIEKQHNILLLDSIDILNEVTKNQNKDGENKSK